MAEAAFLLALGAGLLLVVAFLAHVTRMAMANRVFLPQDLDRRGRVLSYLLYGTMSAGVGSLMVLTLAGVI